MRRDRFQFGNEIIDKCISPGEFGLVVLRILFGVEAAMRFASFAHRMLPD